MIVQDQEKNMDVVVARKKLSKLLFSLFILCVFFTDVFATEIES